MPVPSLVSAPVPVRAAARLALKPRVSIFAPPAAATRYGVAPSRLPSLAASSVPPLKVKVLPTINPLPRLRRPRSLTPSVIVSVPPLSE